ncbi:mucin-19-like isoform X2 [Daphnia pulex]|uniref:mucin-19-like isoform X2 n=1 Tax=Daphnia pulex TaxID=6669 RepID=UPI001EDF864B|nr:mucin-19-like isoform X2 [Daphnia pulex]
MVGSLHFLVALIVALSSVQANVVREDNIARLLSEGRAAATVITVVTSTATEPTTTTKTTRLVCAVIEAPSTTTPCRQKRQFWNAPLFFALGQHDVNQFDGLNPTQVLQVEPSALPAPVEYRNRPAFRPIASQQFNSPFAIQSSLSNKVQPLALRVADPFFGAARFSAFSSLFSNIISSILTPAVTSTRTQTVYTTTRTVTTTTATVRYTLKRAQCLPAGVVVCPSDASTTAATTTAGTTTAATTTAGVSTDATTTAGVSTDATTTAGVSTDATTTAGVSTDATTAETTTTGTETTTTGTETTTTGGGFFRSIFY